MPPPPLPENVRHSLRVAWHISSWCNYSCGYCGVLVFHQRSSRGPRQAHAFDHQPVDKWVEALRAFPQREIYLKITGGEPFLDRANFLALLKGLGADERFTLRIDTNGSWDPAYFAGVDKSRIQLNVSYHPGEIAFASYLKRLEAIRSAGFRVEMVNFVVAPENLEATGRALARLERAGFFVNVSAMIPSGIYAGRQRRTARELELLEEYNTPIDLHFRLVNPVTRGRLCWHPAFSYYLLYDGNIKVYCGGALQNLFTAGAPPLPAAAIPCPYEHCESCVEMYRALTDEPLRARPLSLYRLDEYVAEVQAYRRGRRVKRWWGRWRRRLRPGVEAGENGAAPLVAIQPAAAEVVGELDGPTVEARSRDRIVVSGWAASRTHGPVREVRLKVEDQEIGVVRHFQPRPEVAGRLGRPDLAECGWQVMAYLPALRPGCYRLGAQAVTAGGAAAELAPLKLRIIE